MNWYKETKWKDNIPGGLADKNKPSDFDSKQLQKGIKVELEHTDNKQTAKEIAMDHLKEDSKYYDKLQEMESKDKKQTKEAKKKKYKFNPSNPSNIRAYQLGYLAQNDHQHDDCPYEAGTEQRHAWNRGWNDAERDD